MFFTIFSPLDNPIRNIAANNGATVAIAPADVINTL
jgi:hypothetical protein